MRSLALAILLPCAALSGGLAERIDSALASAPAARQAFWGIRVVDLQTGSVVYERNPEQFFVPASNTKLFSTALALLRLGPGYRFVTTVTADAPPDSRGRVTGLRLVGGGDPNLSARILPYQRNGLGPNPLAAIDDFAASLVEQGVRIVDGDIAGDDTAYVWEPFPNGWAIDDPIWEYGAPVSALTLNDNAFTLTAAPGSLLGDAATLSLSPPLEYLTIHNRTRTVESGDAKLIYERIPDSPELTVRGTLRLAGPPVKAILAIDDPALFAASAFRDALRKRGIQVTGRAVAAHRLSGDDAGPHPSIELARHASLPLLESLRVINKVSQNLHAEILLREVARARNGVGTLAGGLEELKAFLTEIGVDGAQYHFEDGSGLSRLNLVTPLAVSQLLVFLYNTPHREDWIGTLPVGGLDGSLYMRFEGAPEAGNIRAKTGSVSHVSALSGYALRKDGGACAFSILVNNHNSDSAAIRRVIDQVALALVK